MKRLQEDAPLYMKAQLPFNLNETEEINMSYYVDGLRDERDEQDLLIMMQNMLDLNVRPSIYKHNIRFLDVGFGTGLLLEHLCEKGSGQYYGIEPLTKVYEKYYPNFKKANTQNIDLEHYEPSVSFHIIHTFFLLEHLINPLVLFDKAREWLVKGGKLIITCPNADCWVKGRHEIESHRWLPDRKTLLEIARRYNFKVNKYFTYGGFPSPRNVFKEMANKVIKFFNKGDVICMMLEKM
jgi:SAM-dependent methyltransferase